MNGKIFFRIIFFRKNMFRKIFFEKYTRTKFKDGPQKTIGYRQYNLTRKFVRVNRAVREKSEMLTARISRCPRRAVSSERRAILIFLLHMASSHLFPTFGSSRAAPASKSLKKID